MTDDVVVVEPVVAVEKLRMFLAAACEISSLDYKRRVDLDDHGDLVEFAKDGAAMRSCGGYLMIGHWGDTCPVALNLTKRLKKVARDR